MPQHHHTTRQDPHRPRHQDRHRTKHQDPSRPRHQDPHRPRHQYPHRPRHQDTFRYRHQDHTDLGTRTHTDTRTQTGLGTRTHDDTRTHTDTDTRTQTDPDTRTHSNTDTPGQKHQRSVAARGSYNRRNLNRVYPVLTLHPATPTPTTYYMPPTLPAQVGPGRGVGGGGADTAVPRPGSHRRTPHGEDSASKMRSVLGREGRTSGEGEGSPVSTQGQSGSSVMEWGGDGGSERPPVVSAGDVASVVSVVLVGEGGEGLLEGLACAYPGLTVHLATSGVSARPHTPQLRLHVHTESNKTDGTRLTRALRHVTTRYVMVAAGAVSLEGLERLVWAVDHLGVWAAGGMLQSESGEWRPGCLTSHYTHYEAAWAREQLGTAGECQLCHALEGPFLALTVALRYLGWNTEVGVDADQLELFLRAAHTHHMLAAACPASLSTLTSLPKPPSRASLLSLARHHDLYSVQVPGRAKITFSCSELSVSCSGGSLALPPCCRKDLAGLIRFTMDTCEAHGLLCELQEGSLLGAVKMGGVLPWEHDADITFHTGNFTALAELKEVFDRAGYSLYLTDNRWCCVGGRWAGGQGVVSSGRWRAELWSQHAMDAEEDLLAARPRTRVEFDGSWVAAPSNPGQYARNRYGVEVYRHAQHWLDTGRGSGWDEYEAGKFLPCPNPAHHACLDQYPPDGNLRLHPLCVA